MLNLNIKSSSYMCLDINQHSTLDKHLAKKVTDLTKYTESTFNKIISKEFPEDNHDHHASEHNLTMLPSFHISLGAPLKHNKSKQIQFWGFLAIEMFIGIISLADIHISKSNDKKSAWISVDKFILQMLDNEVETQICNFDCEFDKDLYYATGKLPNWHISLANLTGNPHDSIARPEDCIIDTITA